MDTGATSSAIMPRYENMLRDAYKSTDIMHAFNNTSTPIRKTGKLGILDRVHSIEGLSFNILSISQLCNKTTPFRFVVDLDPRLGSPGFTLRAFARALLWFPPAPVRDEDDLRRAER